MYDDALYYAPSQSSAPAGAKTAHVRRQSLLEQPSGIRSIANTTTLEAIGDASAQPPWNESGPPAATLARRAKSYSDFYDIVREHIRTEREAHKTKRDRRKQIEGVKNDVDFADWYAAHKQRLVDSSHEEYRTYRDQLDLVHSHLSSLLISTNSTLDLLSSLSQSFRTVEAQTTAFRAQCEGLLAEQQRGTKLANDISENLQYYLYLEPITKRLNAPGAGNRVRDKEYSEMLSNLDNCLEYVQAHPNHRESATYRSRYRLLLTRGLTLIRVHFTNSLREIAADVSKRIADRQLNDTTMSALLYAKFRVGAPELKRIALEIQKRAARSAGAEAGAEAEYQSLMNELYQSYTATRGRLILPLVSKKIAAIAIAPSTAKDLIAFARSSISYLRGICYDEYDLWGEWFDTDAELYDFLEAMCEPLFDHLRPRTIHETQLLKLCELCTLIQTRYMEEEDDDDDDVPEIKAHQLDFSSLIQPALQDAQTRLVFLALAVLRDEIEHYKPKPEDLDYPSKNRNVALSGTKGSRPALSGRKTSSNGPQNPIPKAPKLVEDEDGMDTRWTLDTEAAFQGWYPTLRKAIWLLSRIYRLVNSTVFDDIAHQIVHQTTLSLHLAATQIATRVSPTDSQLFLIKHLLILKQQIVAFDIEFVTPEVTFDFSTVTNTFWELRERGSLFNPLNLVRLVGSGLVPRVVENMLDAKVELDGRLRAVINEFTNGFASRMTSAIAQKASEKRAFDATDATRAVREAIEKETPFLRQKVDEYLDDKRTKETLVAAVQDLVQEKYEDFYDEHMSKSGKKASRKGKGAEGEIWDPDLFGEWCEGVFKVGRLEMQGLRDVEDDDGVSTRSISRSGST